MCLDAYCSIADSFMRSEPKTGDPDQILIHVRCGAIDWWFEDRLIRWSEDLYQFVQWRPDGDSVPKLRHFMWVFAFILSSYFSLSVIFICYLYYFMWLFDSYLTSMITHTISYDVSECTLLLYSLSERLSASFHVIVGHPYWFRTSWGIPYTVT